MFAADATEIAFDLLKRGQQAIRFKVRLQSGGRVQEIVIVG